MAYSALVTVLFALGVLPSVAEGDQPVSYCEAKNLLVYGGLGFRGWFDSPYSSKIVCRALGASRERLLWQGKSPIRSVRVSSKGLVAFRQRTMVKSKTSEDIHDLVKVIDLDGKEIRLFPRACGFLWSPDGRYMLYVTGCYSDTMGLLDCDPDGVWLWDTETNETKKIIGHGYRFDWARFDGNVYVEDSTEDRGSRFVRCYDPRTGEVRDTKFQSVGFSPDGRFSVESGGEGGFNLYETSSGREITGTSDSPFPPVVEEAMTFGYWYDNDTLVGYLPFRYRLSTQWYYLYNIRSGEVRRCPDYIVSATGPKKGELVVMRQKADETLFTTVRFSDLAIVSVEVLKNDIEENRRLLRQDSESVSR